MSSLKEKVAKVYARYVVWKTTQWAAHPNKTQQKVFKKLLAKGKKTRFGKEHSFEKIVNHEDFSKQVPVRDYEGLKKYIKLITIGEKMFYGQECQFTLLKHQGLRLAKNSFRLLKTQCLIT